MRPSVSRSADPLKITRLKSLVSIDGRRVGFLYSTPCLALGSFGVAACHSVPELLFWRAFQAAGSSAGMSTGMAIIGDIYKLEERGTAMGITFGVRFSRAFHVARAVNNALFAGSSDRTSGCPTSRGDRHRVRFRDHFRDDLAFIDGFVQQVRFLAADASSGRMHCRPDIFPYVCRHARHLAPRDSRHRQRVRR